MFLIRLLEKGWAVESAKRGARFLLSLYKNRDCFFYIFFLSRWKGSERSGGNLRWFPLDPLSTSDRGSAPLGRPRSRLSFAFLIRLKWKSTARATFHHRARVVLELCLAEFAFLVRRWCGDRVEKVWGRGGRFSSGF